MRTGIAATARGIAYADGQSPTSSISAGRLLKQLTGVAKERMKAGRIRNSSDFDYLPKPSADEATLEADLRALGLLSGRRRDVRRRRCASKWTA